MLIGYARASSTGSSLDMQRSALIAAGCGKIFAEKCGISAGRYALEDALALAGAGDTLIVGRLDRVARSADELRRILATLDAKGAGFRCLEQGGLEMTAGAGRPLLDMLAAVAGLETDIRKERQREGIAKAKVNGVYKGRKPSVNTDAVRSLHRQGFGPVEIARQLGIGRASVYRALS